MVSPSPDKDDQNKGGSYKTPFSYVAIRLMTKTFLLFLPLHCWAIYSSCPYCPQYPVVYQSALPAATWTASPTTVIYRTPRYRVVSVQEPVESEQINEAIEMDEDLKNADVKVNHLAGASDEYDPFGPVRQGYGLQPPHATFRTGKLNHYHHHMTSLKTEMVTKGFGGGDSYYAGAATPKEMIGQKGGYGEAHMPAMENTANTGMLQNSQEPSKLKWLEKEIVSQPDFGVEKQTKITQQMGAIEKEEKIGESQKHQLSLGRKNTDPEEFVIVPIEEYSFSLALQ
ncbi:unnamed protein product [Haemonchus placei]|uniref:Uncharacterized protein n=1 Tax=Haemonchus placei TaxID=6290 RepID=A0A0N4X6Y9_HAEPC|nr:unnamed protein product [Haemonchus placei]